MNKEKSITEQEVSCECGWHGTVIECGCDADMPDAEDDGRTLYRLKYCLDDFLRKNEGSRIRIVMSDVMYKILSETAFRATRSTDMSTVLGYPVSVAGFLPFTSTDGEVVHAMVFVESSLADPYSEWDGI